MAAKYESTDKLNEKSADILRIRISLSRFFDTTPSVERVLTILLCMVRLCSWPDTSIV